MSVIEEAPSTPPHGFEYKRDGRIGPIDLSDLTNAVDREIRNLKDVITIRVNAVEKAQETFQNDLTRVPTQVDREVKALRELIESKIDRLADVTNERFEGVAKQFSERDKRTEQLSLADKTAIAAALQAQKEAAGAQNESNTTSTSKMEGSFSRLIDLMSNRIDDVKTRLDKGEGRTTGVGATWSFVIAIGGLAIGAAGVVTAVLALAK